MVQFNLLPDVKLQYVKAQRTKQLIMLTSIIVSIASLAVLLVSFASVNIVQKKSIHDLNSDIAKYSGQLRSVKDLDKILTVQNQLTTLKGLHDQKPVTSRLFGYLTQVTPSKATLNQLNVDFSANTITFGGQADTLDTVSKYTDTLKSTMYTVDGSNAAPVNAFSSVVLASFGRGDTGASFTITCSFDPAIFQSDKVTTLVVPKTADSSQSSVFKGSN